jgi:hypothetical protein
MEYLRGEPAFWTSALAFFPCVTLSVNMGPSAVTLLLTTEVETGLLEGVPEADELIRGLLLVAFV